jgi:O-antigen ligase
VDNARSRPVTKTALLAALAGAPVVFVPSMGDIFGLPKLAWTAACVAVAVVAFVVERPDGPGWRRMPGPAVLPFLGAFVGTQALAALTSIDRSTSFLGAYERYNGLLPLPLHLGLAALVVASWWRDPDDTWRLAAAMVVGGAVVATYVLFQVAGLDVVDWVEKSGADVRYQAGSMGNGDFAAAYLGCALLLTPALLGRWPRLVVGGLAIELAAGLVATQGRGGLLAVAIGAVVAVALIRPVDGRRLVLAGIAAAAAVVVVGLVAVATTDVLRTESLRVRQREWAGAAAIFVDRPITGTGQDIYLLRYPAHRSVADGRELGLQIADKPHNLLLEHASGTGILGLAAFVVMLVVIGRWGIARVRAHDAPADRVLPASFLATAAGYLAHAMFSFDVPALTGLWWVTLAVIVIQADPALVAGHATKPKRAGQPTGATVPLLGAVAVAVVLFVVVGRAVLADVAAGRALAGEGEAALADGERALDLHPAQPAYALVAGAAGEQAGATTDDDAARPDLFRRAVTAYRHGLDDQPDNVLLHAGLARTLTLAGRAVDRSAFVEADREWRTAVELDPNDWELHEGYGLMLNHWANASGGSLQHRSAAADELRRALEIRPDRAATWSTLGLVLESLGRDGEAAEAAARGLYLDPTNAEARALADRLAAR